MQHWRTRVIRRKAPPPSDPVKKAFIKSYGCQMNVYDAERMADVLEGQGYAPTQDQDAADLIILNTCHIREKAAEKVYSELGRIRVAREARKEAGEGDTMVIVAGCVAQAEGGEILRRAPVVDAVIGPQSYHRLPDVLARAKGRNGPGIVETEFPVEDKFDHLPAPQRKAIAARGPAAFLTVQEGCDKFCAFCVVPYTRGAEVSRPVAQIVEEARRLAEAGVREITLIGQNVNAWHGEGPAGRAWTLGRLLERLAGIEGIARLRYTTSHPRDMDDELIAAHRDIPAVMPYLHLPVQAGSDRILAAMNRRHTAAHYLDIIARVRAARPDIAITSDFIVGFPGETEADFAETLKLVDEVGFAGAYSFKYSPRPGTPAADAADQVPDEVMAARLAILQERIEAQRVAFNAAMRGRMIDVLIERQGRHPGQMAGKSPYLQAVQIETAQARIGEIVRARVEEIGPHSLYARLEAPAGADAA